MDQYRWINICSLYVGPILSIFWVNLLFIWINLHYFPIMCQYIVLLGKLRAECSELRYLEIKRIFWKCFLIFCSTWISVIFDFFRRMRRKKGPRIRWKMGHFAANDTIFEIASEDGGINPFPRYVTIVAAVCAIIFSIIGVLGFMSFNSF